MALVVEVVLLGGVVAFLAHEAPAPAVVQAQPTMLTLAAPAPQPAPAPPAPVRHNTTPVHHVEHVVPPVAKPQPVERPPVVPAAVPTEPPAEPPHPSPPAAPTTAAAHTSKPASGSPTPSFEGAMRAAIQAALRYPEAARMAGMSGRTRVAFRYRDGVVSDMTVVVSSGVGMLDRAALAAVRDANYPKPEPAFVGKTLSEQLWVTFNLDDE
jgi:periplasmic protein TonB